MAGIENPANEKAAFSSGIVDHCRRSGDFALTTISDRMMHFFDR
ncbi:MAG: hypothetical protein RIB97_02590 [Nitratireductor sp.]